MAFYGQNQCTNMDFEYGDATGWELYKGSVNGQVAQMNNTILTNLSSTQFTLFNAGIDPHGNFPRVNPASGNYSLRIGDNTTAGGKAASAKRTFLVDSSNANFQYSFAVVLEGIPSELSKKITDSVSIPTIGIGAGPHCDGQIQVFHDILGLFDTFVPKLAETAPIKLIQLLVGFPNASIPICSPRFK